MQTTSATNMPLVFHPESTEKECPSAVIPDEQQMRGIPLTVRECVVEIDANETAVATPLEKPGPMRRGSAVLAVTPYAWAKMAFMCAVTDTEVGMMGISASQDELLVVEDVFVPKQEAWPSYVVFDDAPFNLQIADLCDPDKERKLQPSQCARIWIHTHPTFSPMPSGIDERTFSEKWASVCDWAVMLILSKTHGYTARMSCLVDGRPEQRPMRVEIAWERPFRASDQDAWLAELNANVRRFTARRWDSLARSSACDLFTDGNGVQCSSKLLVHTRSTARKSKGARRRGASGRYVGNGTTYYGSVSDDDLLEGEDGKVTDDHESILDLQAEWEEFQKACSPDPDESLEVINRALEHLKTPPPLQTTEASQKKTPKAVKVTPQAVKEDKEGGKPTILLSSVHLLHGFSQEELWFLFSDISSAVRTGRVDREMLARLYQRLASRGVTMFQEGNRHLFYISGETEQELYGFSRRMGEPRMSGQELIAVSSIWSLIDIASPEAARLIEAARKMRVRAHTLFHVNNMMNYSVGDVWCPWEDFIIGSGYDCIEKERERGRVLTRWFSPADWNQLMTLRAACPLSARARKIMKRGVAVPGLPLHAAAAPDPAGEDTEKIVVSATESEKIDDVEEQLDPDEEYACLLDCGLAIDHLLETYERQSKSGHACRSAAVREFETNLTALCKGAVTGGWRKYLDEVLFLVEIRVVTTSRRRWGTDVATSHLEWNVWGAEAVELAWKKRNGEWNQ